MGLGWGQPSWDWGNTFLVSGAGDKGNRGFGKNLLEKRHLSRYHRNCRKVALQE